MKIKDINTPVEVIALFVQAFSLKSTANWTTCDSTKLMSV